MEESHQQYLGFIVRLQAAIRTVRLYPPLSPLITSSIDALQADLKAILEDRDTFLLAESENSLIVDGAPLGKRNQQKDQAAALLQLFKALGLKSLSFSKGLTGGELKQLVELLSIDSRNLSGETIQSRFAEKQMSHIHVNQKVFVAVDEDSQILPGLQIKDEELVRYFTGNETPREDVLEKMRSLAQNPQWIAGVFASGLERLTTRLGPAPNDRLSASVGQMLNAMDRVMDHGSWSGITEQLAAKVSKLDIEAVTAVAMQNTDDHLGEVFFKSLAEHLDDKKFQELATRLENRSLRETRGQAAAVQSEKPVTALVLRLLMDSKRGRRLKEKRAQAAAPKKETQPHYTEGFKTELSKILKGDLSPLNDNGTAGTLAELVRTLLNSGKHNGALQIIDTLAGGMAKAPREIHPAIVQCLGKIADSPTVQQEPRITGTVTRRLTQWLKRQEKATPVLGSVCSRLVDSAKKMIKSENYGEALPVAEALRVMAEREPAGETALRECGREALEKLADTEIQDLLLAEIDSNRKSCREEASQLLICLGPFCVERLLDILHHSRTGQERVRILKLIANMGDQAAPFVRRAIGGDEPWYFLRNLARLLGEIGNQGDLDVLVPLLDHQEFRVRWQALNSIYQIGGERRGELLLQRLAGEEDRMKIHIVTMLGELRQREAVPALVKLLEKKSLVKSGEKVQLQKKVCTALARIGSPLAIPVLSEIARGGMLRRMGSYHPQVREEARLSLHSLQVS